MFAFRKRGMWPSPTRSSEHMVHWTMDLELTDRAAHVIRRKGGTAVVDLLEPFG